MKIALSRLNTTILSWLANQLITDSEPEKYPFIKDHPLLIALQTTYARYNVLFGKESYSGKGKLVAKANIVQNNAFNGMKFCVYGLTKVDGNSLQADAKDVYSVFKLVGISLSRNKYMAKSTGLAKLIDILERPENTLKIERLHLAEVFNLLKMAHLNFENLALEQISANAKLRQMGTASAFRKDMEAAIHNYLAMAAAMKEFDGWDKFYALLNESVKGARNAHRSRKNKPDDDAAFNNLIPEE